MFSRFIVNLPEADKLAADRLLFHLEAAHWFYDDHLRTSSEKADVYPSMKFPKFCRQMLNRDPALSHLVAEIPQLIEFFSAHKRSVPVAGVILLNPSLTKCLMVRGHRSRDTWAFPKGKLSEGESMAHCATRELYEETGYNCGGASVL
ncbi:hypothetical protein DI09_63p60 [Mitosporidium daphniae]|uniref:Nudix hydrolase domain-containing protein n=1 Tax=Mitosporidium daphniae TaxID=1485682 RepID=A0A098VNC9_9MICR|nr:uncharacterized protein DI09_63p60 [Mitosporidium daphniae]KGG50582.1 hypothetical protein DI09_63p60 [Mitosporidium daphniae]|eukprot:XP_013237029.1 uncharacterized protein DI09_63p60 [Mitosporidium daphniae]